MSGYGEAYLVVVIVAFLGFVGTLFGSMVSTRHAAGDDANHRSG